MKFQLVKGEQSVILTVFIQDSSATDGSGLAGLIHTSSIVGGYVKRNGTGVALAVDEDVATEGTYQAPSAVGKVRIGTPANMTAGTYELHFHNDLFTTADWVTITLGGAANMAPLPIEVQLTDFNPNDGVRGGLTALPNAAADANNGIVTGDGSVTFTAGVGNRPAVDAEAIHGGVPGAEGVEAAGAAYDTQRGLSGTALPAANAGTAAGLAMQAKVLAYVQLLARGDEAIETDNSTELTEINADGGSGGGSFASDADALEAIRDHGDQAWLTGAGAGATVSYTTTAWTRIVGDDEGGTGSNTTTVDGQYFTTGEINSTTLLEVQAVFTITDGEVGETVDLWGFYTGGAGHSVEALAKDMTSGIFEPLVGNISTGTTVKKYSFTLSPNHTDTGADTITVRFRHLQGVTGITSHVFSVDKGQVNTITPATPAPSEASIADAVWDELETGHDGAGKAGAQLWAALDAIPTTAEFEARTIVSANYFDASSDEVITNAASRTASKADVSALALAATALTDVTWTDARAGYLDELEATNLPADIDQIKADLPNTITKNTALANFPFLMVLSSDHVTGATGKTITATRSLDGGAFAPCANNVFEVASGAYKIDFEATDTNGDTVMYLFTAADCDARLIAVITKPT